MHYYFRMDRSRRNSGVDGRQASGLPDQFGCADEFRDPMTIEDLAERWRCSQKTARAKIIAHGLGINPAGTWLVSRQQVHKFEESLRKPSKDEPAGQTTALPDCSQERVRAELARLGILRSRRRTPDKGLGASRPFRKAG